MRDDAGIVTLQAGMRVRLSESLRKPEGEFDPYVQLWGREDGHVVIVKTFMGAELAGVRWHGWSQMWQWFNSGDLEVVS